MEEKHQMQVIKLNILFNIEGQIKIKMFLGIERL